MDLTENSEAAVFRAKIRPILLDGLPDGWQGLGKLSEEEQSDFHIGWRKHLRKNGLLGPTIPAQYGGAELTDIEQTVLTEEISRTGIPQIAGTSDSSIFQLLVPALLRFGTDAQRERFLPPMLSGEDTWCQGFSEPGSGSDLASLSSSAVRDGDEYIINGQKVWTSGGHLSNWIFTLVRTDSEASKHKGISLLLIPISQPGVEVRSIRQITGNPEFNEVFFNNARTSAENLIGQEGDGWNIALSILNSERGDNSITMSYLFQSEAQRLVELIRQQGRHRDPSVKIRLAETFLRVRALRLLAMRSASAASNGEMPGSEASIIKLFWSEHWQKTAHFALSVLGPDALETVGDMTQIPNFPEFPGAPNSSGSWTGSWLNSFSGTIYAGTSEIQRNIIAERVLGLPK